MSTENAPELGITEADRRKMARMAATYRKERESDEGRPSLTHPNVQEVRKLLLETDRNYLKARHLAEESELSAYAIGSALGRLELEGEVEKAAYTGAMTWRILDVQPPEEDEQEAEEKTEEPVEDTSNTGPPPALPCRCGPGIRNIQDTASDLDYECPTCGATFTRDELD